MFQKYSILSRNLKNGVILSFYDDEADGNFISNKKDKRAPRNVGPLLSCLVWQARMACTGFSGNGQEIDGLDHHDDPNTAGPPVLIRRKPRLLLAVSGAFLFRLAARTFLGLLFQLPPRLTRLDPSFYPDTLWCPPDMGKRLEVGYDTICRI